MIGRYQTAANADGLRWSQEVILFAMEAILARAKASNHQVLFLGDVNTTACQLGSCWGQMGILAV